jgi:ankyrin repeat protein
MTALHIAAQSMASDLCRALQNNPRIRLDIKDYENHRLPLHLCVLGRTESDLGRKFFCPYSWSADPAGPLFRRLAMQMPETLNAFDKSGSTPLHYALQRSSFECNFLRDLTIVDLTLTNEIKETYLHLAARSGNEMMCQMMLNRHPELVNFRNDYGETPLHYAARSGQIKIIVCLLMTTGIDQHPIDIHRVCFFGFKQPLDHATDDMRPELEKLLPYA